MTTLIALADALTTSIQTRIADPAGWLLEARRLCEAAGLSAARAVLMPATLTTVSYSIAREAFAQGEAAVARLEAVLAATLAAHGTVTTERDRDHEALESHLRAKPAYGRTDG